MMTRLLQLRPGQGGDTERIGQVRDHARGNGLGTLTDQAGIGAEQKHGANIRPWLTDESLGLARLQLHFAGLSLLYLPK
jgi:hypothetical protein